jgi:transaldolase/glucose-6-phosphate isomerase
LIEPAELVERIWQRDPTVWTGHDEASWLGWLDEPRRMRQRLPELREFGEAARGEFSAFVLLGMGGSSLAPEVFRQTFRAADFHVLDTTHPQAIRRLEESLDLKRTLFVASSKSGTTLETRSHLDYFWERAGRRGRQFAVVTDPGSKLEGLAREREFRAVFAGEPTIGGRYSALSAFGLVPAVLQGVDLERLLTRVEEMIEACRVAEDNPGLELGLAFGRGWESGRDKICINPNPGGFGLWAEQLIAESTGKEGKGLVPAPGEAADGGPDRQPGEVRVDDPYDLGAEFFRWELATAVAGAILGINPFDQPNVQEAKDKTNEVLSGHDPGTVPGTGPEWTVDDVLAQAREGNYVAIQAFIDPTREPELSPLIARAHETGCVVTHGLGPRYLHSTGQLHKGGPPIGLFIQVSDETGGEIPIPGRKFGFGRLIRAQAQGDYSTLTARGRPVARARLEDL